MGRFCVLELNVHSSLIIAAFISQLNEMSNCLFEIGVIVVWVAPNPEEYFVEMDMFVPCDTQLHLLVDNNIGVIWVELRDALRLTDHVSQVLVF